MVNWENIGKLSLQVQGLSPFQDLKMPTISTQIKISISNGMARRFCGSQIEHSEKDCQLFEVWNSKLTQALLLHLDYGKIWQACSIQGKFMCLEA